MSEKRRTGLGKGLAALIPQAPGASRPVDVFFPDGEGAKRAMRAEKLANKIPTKMTLGTMLFTVPPLLIILIGPSVHDMMAGFATMNN